MKERWNNLTLREKQTLSLGVLVIGILIIYLLVLSPLNNKVNTMRDQIHHNQDLLAWMQQTDKQIQDLAKTAQPTPTVHATGSLLSIVQKQINRTPLVSSLKQLHQGENDSVQMSFQQVDFDQLMAWLIQLSQQGLIVSQMSVTPSAAPGIVATDLVLKNG